MVGIEVGIDLEYKKLKEASISIWWLKTSLGDDGQPEGEVIKELNINILHDDGDITHIEQLFRDAEGNPILSSSGLNLPLNNFAVQALSNGLPDSSVTVDPETLCKLLSTAEKWNDKSTLLQGIKPAPIKRKYRQPTPDEQLTMSDEEKIIEEERRVQRKTEKADKPYTGSEGGLF